MDLVTEILMPAQATKVTPGVRWSSVENRAIYASIWTGAQWVAVGEGGIVITSPDGESWTQQKSGTSADLKSISFFGNLLLVVGNGIALTSADNGKTWSVKTNFPKGGLFISVGNLNCSFWTGGDFFVGGNAIGLIGADGLSYTGFSKPNSSFNIFGCVKYGDLYVVAGVDTTTTNIYTSASGASWVGINSGVSALRGLASSGSLLVAVGDGGAILTSTTGQIWTNQNSNVTTNLQGVIWTGTQFVAFGVNGVVLTSANGVIWSKCTEGLTSSFGEVYSNSLYCVACSSDKFIAFASTGFMLSSANTVSWSDAGALVPPDMPYMGEDLLWTGSYYLSCGASSSSDGDAFYKSLDGRRWTAAYSGAWDILCFASSASLIVAVDEDGYARISPDGVTWDIVRFADWCDFQKMIWDGEKFVAFGGCQLQSDHIQRDYAAWTSTNGRVWQFKSEIEPPGANSTYADAAYSGDCYVVLCNARKIYKSTDLITWTAIELYSDYRLLKAIDWTGTHFVVVTSNSGYMTTGIMTSINGTDWSYAGKYGTYSLNDVAWINGLLVIVGDNGLIWTCASIESNLYVARASGTTSDLLQVAGGSGHMVALGRLNSEITNICRSS